MMFNNFINILKSFWGGAAAVAVAGPLILWGSELDPPWPPGNASRITTLFCATAVILAYALGRTLGNLEKPP